MPGVADNDRRPRNWFCWHSEMWKPFGRERFFIYICLQIKCSSQTKIRLVGWSECKHIFNGIVVQSQVLVSGGRFIQSRQEPGIFEWVAVEKDKSLVLAWPQQPQALSASPTAIDLFAGIGGSHIACDCIGLPVAYAVDIDARLCRFYSRTFPHAVVENCDIVDPELSKTLAAYTQQGAHVWLGTPPCPPFSAVSGTARQGVSTAKGRIIFSFFQHARNAQAPCCIVENVAGMLSSNSSDDLQAIRNYACWCGYATFVLLIDSAKFVPQSRRRILLVGVRGDLMTQHLAHLMHAVACHTWSPIPPSLNWFGIPLREDLLTQSEWNDRLLSDEEKALYTDKTFLPRGYVRSVAGCEKLSTLVHMYSRGLDLPKHCQDAGGALSRT